MQTKMRLVCRPGPALSTYPRKVPAEGGTMVPAPGEVNPFA
jgi:hypothetical protein